MIKPGPGFLFGDSDFRGVKMTALLSEYGVLYTVCYFTLLTQFDKVSRNQEVIESALYFKTLISP